MIEASIESDRPGEARRHLDAMAAHPDTQGVERLRRELEVRIANADRAAAERRANTGSFPAVVVDSAPERPVTPGTAPGGGGSVAPVDVRDKGSRLMGFLRR